MKVNPDAPVSPFGAMQWEAQLEGTADREEEFSYLGKVRHLDNGNVAVNIKRKAFKSDGTANIAVGLVDAKKQPITTFNNLGNGSTGNVKLYRAEYEYAGKKGITTIMSAIQITDLVIYTGSVDFDMETDDSPMAAHDDF
jgi:hypothetical protein|tara:strand:- start:778 stop:1197 length:420 start_codon:yes stop_codon:yes gene_type:complete